jgi:DNA-binding CsgD family transcriptional regulator
VLTRLLVALAQADEPEMQSIIDQINFRDPFAGRERIAIAAVTQALQATNRPRAFEALRPTFESWLSDIDSTTIAAELGANRHLFAPWHPSSSPISSEEWSKLRALPSALRGLPEVTCSVAVQSPADASTSVWPIETWRGLVIGSWCLLFLGAWLLIREFRLRRALQATFNAVPAAQRAILDQALYMNMSRRSLLKARALIALRMLRHEEEIGALADENLTGQERLALVRLRAGKTADAVAKETGLPRRKLKALLDRMGLSVGLLLLLLASFPSEASAETLPADSAWQWLERGDSAAWFSALASGVVLEASDQVPDAVTIAFAAKESRPAWAEIGDDQIWAELRHALPVLMDERQILEGIQSPGFDPGFHAEHWEWERSKAWRSRLGWAFSTAALVLLSALVLFLLNRTLLNSLPNDVAALDAAWGKGGEALLEALPESLTLAAPKPDNRQDRWGLLSASEQEVAIYLAEGLSAVAIAHRMSCTTRYIYNMRSSIRKKWDLDADEDLMGAIRTHQLGG